jgi:hypothetical protein
MTVQEDRLRAALLDLAAYDVPAGGDMSASRQSLQPAIRREQHHRWVNRSLAVAASVAVLLVCLAVGRTLWTATAGRTATAASAANDWYSTLPGHQTQIRDAKSYIVATGTANGHRWEMDSVSAVGSTWLSGDLGGARYTFFTNGQVGDIGASANGIYGASVTGFVPYDAHTVTVHVHNGPTITVPAVATPTSDQVRFFAVAYPWRYVNNAFTVTGTEESGHPLPLAPGAPRESAVQAARQFMAAYQAGNGRVLRAQTGAGFRLLPGGLGTLTDLRWGPSVHVPDNTKYPGFVLPDESVLFNATTTGSPDGTIPASTHWAWGLVLARKSASSPWLVVDDGLG